MRKVAERSPQDRILDAAENAFAECGFEGASLRSIVCEARVNLATVYYYFRSKDGLMEAVLKRRFGPLRAEHLELLRRFEDEAGGRSLPVEKILEAMLLPTLHLAALSPSRHRAVTRLFGRIATEPNARTQSILQKQRAEVRAVFLKALQSTLPGIPVSELGLRIEFVWGALAFMFCNPQRVETTETGNPEQAERLMKQMVNFFAPALRAPATPKV